MNLSVSSSLFRFSHVIQSCCFMLRYFTAARRYRSETRTKKSWNQIKNRTCLRPTSCQHTTPDLFLTGGGFQGFWGLFFSFFCFTLEAHIDTRYCWCMRVILLLHNISTCSNLSVAPTMKNVISQWNGGNILEGVYSKASVDSNNIALYLLLEALSGIDKLINNCWR